MKRICIALVIAFLLCGCSTRDEASAEFTTSPETTISSHDEIAAVYVIQRNEYNENGQIQKETYFEMDNQGLVSEVERTEYAYDNAENLIEERTFWDSSDECTITESFEYDNNNRLCKVYSYNHLSELYEYDEHGNLTSKYCYDSRGTLTDSEEYIYDNSSLLSASYMYCDFDSFEDSEGNDRKIVQRNYIYEEYDLTGRLSKVTSYFHNEEPYYELYTYNNQQTIIQDYSFNGTPGLCTVLDYDNQGRKIRHRISEPNGKVWSLTEYEYADFSRKHVTYGADGTVEYSNITEWDALNRQTFEASYDAEGNLQASWEYIYDDKDYIISIIHIDENGNEHIEVAPERAFYENGNVKSEVFYNNEHYIAPYYRTRQLMQIEENP